MKRLMKGFTIFTALSAATSTDATKITLNTAKGSRVAAGCGNVFECTETCDFELPKELVGNELVERDSTCMFGDGSIRNICTGEVLKVINLKENHLKIIPDDSATSTDGIHQIEPQEMVQKSCRRIVKIKQRIFIPLKKRQKLMFLGDDGTVIDRISGEKIKQLEKGIDYEIVEMSDEKTVSDEEMANVYMHNREDEARNVMQSFRF